MSIPFPYPNLGTTPPIHVPKGAAVPTVRPGEAYFLVRIHSTRVAFYGSGWGSFFFPVRQLLVTSQVDLHRAEVSEKPFPAIQYARPVQRRSSESLGLRSNLIDLVPAVMDKVTIHLEFVLDRKNRLKTLTQLINNSAFTATLSLDPTVAATARTVGRIADRVLDAFLTGAERIPILTFTGDFNLDNGDLKEGYHVILGSRDEKTPLPRPLPRPDELTVADGDVLVKGKPVNHWSYVVLEVIHSPARTRDRAGGMPWEKLFRRAENLAQTFSFRSSPTKTQRKEALARCVDLIIQGQELLLEDPNYLRKEAVGIVATVQMGCEDWILGEAGVKSRTHGQESLPLPEQREVAQPFREALDLPGDDELDRLLDRYATDVERAREALKAGALAY